VRRALPVLLALPLLLGACSSGPDLPEESSFAEGTCRTAAPDVIAVGKALPELGDGPSVDGDVRGSLQDAQDRLAALAETAEPAYKPALDRLVVSIGLVRIRADGNTYQAKIGDGLETSYDEAVEACTAPA
jgi:ferredoxin